jgi:hypothetical protein
MAKNSRAVPGEVGPPCPRCGRRTQVRAHKRVTPKMLAAPWYYSRWFYCTNNKCKTSMIMPDRFRVFPERQPVRTGYDEDIAMSVLAEQDGTPPWED